MYWFSKLKPTVKSKCPNFSRRLGKTWFNMNGEKVELKNMEVRTIYKRLLSFQFKDLEEPCELHLANAVPSRWVTLHSDSFLPAKVREMRFKIWHNKLGRNFHPDLARCAICDQHEDVKHITGKCPHLASLIDSISKNWYSWTGEEVQSSWWVEDSYNGNLQLSRHWTLISSFAIWASWKQRCSVMFDHKTTSFNQVRSSFLSMVRFQLELLKRFPDLESWSLNGKWILPDGKVVFDLE